MQNKNILVTGAAGFIGAHLVLRLLRDGFNVTGVDNLNRYYDVNLKRARLRRIERQACGNWLFKRGNIADKKFLGRVFGDCKPSIVVNLAAQAGVRHSIFNPDDYLESNIVGFFNVLENCRDFNVNHLIYASSSSIFGDTPNETDKPLNFYAATKKSNELMAHSYSSLFRIPATGLRFFTVYGAFGRPDMFYFKCANTLNERRFVYLYNEGNCRRDFTYIADVVEGLRRVIDKPPTGATPHKVYNLGCGKPVSVRNFAEILTDELIQANVLPALVDWSFFFKSAPMQSGDAFTTCADTADFQRDFNFTPKTPLRLGLRAFAKWFFKYTKEA